jgi:3',5'-cyclic-AMP phosphodiesterase
VDDCSAQLTWRASPADGLRLEVREVGRGSGGGGAAIDPEPAPKVPMVLDKPGVAAYRRASAALGEDGTPGPARTGAHAFRNGWRTLDNRWPGGPGAVVVEGLAPGARYEVVARAQGVEPFLAARFSCLRRPPGPELARFATVSDVHVGERRFGIWGRIHDLQYLHLPADRALYYPARALQAAIAEATAWGAGLLVAKGDLTRRTMAAELRDAARLLVASPVPVEAVMGNHECSPVRVNARGVLAAEGLDVSWRPRWRDIEGLRLVLVDSVHADPGRHEGQVSEEVARQVADMVADAPQAAWVGLHHPPEMHRYPVVYPPGVPFGQSRLLLDALVATGKPTVVSAGHRHRNRRYRYGPVEITEVGSTKDYPGVWAGYKVFEGGLVQTVRRIARPDVIAWTENTRRAMNGQWGRWSPGRLADRCFCLTWPG